MKVILTVTKSLDFRSVILSPYGSQRIDSYTKRLRHRQHVRLVSKVGMEEIVGLGNSSHVWRSRIG